VADTLSSPLTPTPRAATPWLAGVIPPVCTPFTEDFAVDVPSLERLVEFLLDGGVNGLFVLGTSSEVAFLRDDQRETIVDAVVKLAGGRVPILAGAIDTTTPRVLAQAHRAIAAGADAIVATAPFYARVNAIEVARHFTAVKEATGVPLVAYDIPPMIHAKLDPADVVALARGGVIDAIKDSSGDLAAFRTLVTGTRELPDFAVLTGSEVIVDAAMMVGGDGVVPGLGNVDPAGYAELYASCRAGDWDRARSQQERLIRLFSITSAGDPGRMGASSAGLGAFKSALMLRGVIATNATAPPLTRLDDGELARVRAGLRDARLL
jgi:4-hydroxy-tetrahydrodipicolinate synthase